MATDALVQSCGALIICIFTIFVIFKLLRDGKDNVFRGFTCKNCWTGPHRQGTLNREGLCESCVQFRETKALTKQIEHKLHCNRMIDTSSPIHHKLERILYELFNDILNDNASLNKEVLQLICGYLGKYCFFRNVASNEDRERLFIEFIASDSHESPTWKYYDHPTYYAVRVGPENMPFVLQNCARFHSKDEWMEWNKGNIFNGVEANSRGNSTVQKDWDQYSAVELYYRLFFPETEDSLFSWTAYDWSYAANRYYPSTDPQRNVQRSYLFAKPNQNRTNEPMYGIMHLTVIPVGL